LLDVILWPSFLNSLACDSVPPGYLGLRLPSSLTTRQYGVICSLGCARDKPLPFWRSSSAASDIIRKNIPSVIGQVESALNFFASIFRICPEVMSLPFGTFQITSSAISGVGTSTFRPPILFCQLAGPAIEQISVTG
jgi:hypothetical protein